MPWPTGFWLAVGPSLVLLLGAAKAHGRQLRLEREERGFRVVDFARRTPNPPWVEALWRSDRVRFWIAAPASAALSASALVALGEFSALPVGLAAPPGDSLVGPLALAVVLWGPSAAFLLNGLASLLRLRRRAGRHAPGADATRLRSSYASWGLVAALLVGTIFLVVRGPPATF